MRRHPALDLASRITHGNRTAPTTEPAGLTRADTALEEDGQTDLCLDLTLGKIGLLNARMSNMKHAHLCYRIL